MKVLFLLSLFTLGCLCVPAQRAKSALLTGEQAKKLASPCSRPGPTGFTATWEPTKEQIIDMESSFDQIRKLSVQDCCIVGARIQKPDEWYMQYAALIWNGEKIIYISATSTDQPKFRVIEEPSGKVIADWRAMAVDVCDGGNAWGVVYHIKTRRFSHLEINGVA